MLVGEFDVPNASIKVFTFMLKLEAPTVKLRLVYARYDTRGKIDRPVFQAQIRQRNHDVPVVEVYSSTCSEMYLLVNASEDLDHVLRAGDFELQPNVGIVVKVRNDGAWERIGDISFSWRDSLESGKDLLTRRRTFELV